MAEVVFFEEAPFFGPAHQQNGCWSHRMANMAKMARTWILTEIILAEQTIQIISDPHSFLIMALVTIIKAMPYILRFPRRNRPALLPPPHPRFVISEANLWVQTEMRPRRYFLLQPVRMRFSKNIYEQFLQPSSIETKAKTFESYMRPTKSMGNIKNDRPAID